ncbi:MAG TPA: GlsB/YeaQ/YmgE family stress response membrane protein [Candidatus Sulfobium mesophilum]|nr:GlsB/YeaQ/YmgE family stress response membrane protein [Candidatus Sulfobium mesophilum]
MHWFWFLIIGVVAGWLAGKITRGHGFGLVGDLAVGILGALVGGFIFRLIGVVSFGHIGSLVTATVGAVVLLWLIRRLR